jgi:hypothetical protein
MSEIAVLKELRKALTSFLDELIETFPQEGDLVIMRIFLNDQIPIKTVMETIVFNLNTNNKEMKKMIKSRNEDFFLNHNLFGDTLGKGKINHIKVLWRSGQLDDDDKQTFWKWIDLFVILTEKYTNVMSSTHNN